MTSKSSLAKAYSEAITPSHSEQTCVIVYVCYLFGDAAILVQVIKVERPV